MTKAEIEEEREKEKRAIIAKYAEMVREEVKVYYKTWGQPVTYQHLIPKYGMRLNNAIEGSSVAELITYLSQHEVVYFALSPSNRKFVFPSPNDVDLDEDEMLEQLKDLDEKFDLKRKEANVRRQITWRHKNSI